MKKKLTIYNLVFAARARGFTLVETLVAIAILSLAMTGPLVIAEKGLSSSLYAQDEVTATYLAQDAIEYVRNVRDTNILNSQPWLTNLSNCMGGNSCQIDTTVPNDPADAITICNSPGPNNSIVCAPINLRNDGLYQYTSGTPQIFTRTVTISSVSGNSDEVLVTAEISWQTSIYTTAQSITISEHIFNI